MKTAGEPVERHYHRGAILNAILDGLRKTGKDPDSLAPGDLAPVDEFHIRGREATEELGFVILEWEDTSRASLDWFRDTLEKLNEHGPPPLGLHLLMGDNARVKLRNQMLSLEQNRMTVIQAVAELE